MPGATSSPPSIIASTNDTVPSSGGDSKGLTTARAAISGWRWASQTPSVPPMERPTTTTASLRAASSVYADSAAPDQSSHRVSSMSTMSVPWPGSNGISTVNPASASAKARPRIDCGLPVKPCRTNAPRPSPTAE